MPNKFKLLLIQPPIEDFYETDERLQPIGLCYLKSAVDKHLPNFSVIVKDYHQGFGRRTIPLPKELAYLKGYYSCPDKSPFSSFYHYYHFGASFDEIAREVAEIKPDIIGISSLFSPYYREAIKTAEAIKQVMDIPIIFGGSHVSAMPEMMISHDVVDFIIRGEGERPIVEFLKAWQTDGEFSHVPNMGYKNNGKILLNPIEPNYPISEISPPDFSDLPIDNYQYENTPLSFILTSRGCPYKCSFCSVHQTFGDHYRRRKVENIFDEIVLRYEQGYRAIDFEDDNLTLNEIEFKQLCEKIIEHFPNSELKLLAMNGVSYMNLDREILLLMKQAGFSNLNISLVSSQGQTQDRINRPFSLEKYMQVVNDGFDLGFNIVSYQILGLPSEDLNTMIDTMVLHARLPVLIGPSMFYLTPNSPIAADFPQMSEEDVFKSRLTAMAIESDNFSREDLFTLFISARIINFIKGLSFEEQSCDLSSLTTKHTNDTQNMRTEIGIDLLKKLFNEKKLYAVNKNDLKPITKFKADLFYKLLGKIDYITTLNGKRIISLSDFE